MLFKPHSIHEEGTKKKEETIIYSINILKY